MINDLTQSQLRNAIESKNKKKRTDRVSANSTGFKKSEAKIAGLERT